MNIGIGNYYIDKYGIDEGVRRMAEDGYTHIDLQLMDTETEIYAARDDEFFMQVMALRKKLSDGGITINQIHGPWRYPVRDNTDEDRAERFEKMTKAIVIARHLGAKYVAVHPLMPFGENSPESPDEVKRINMQFFKALANVAGSLGVTVCLENMPFTAFPLGSVEQIVDFLKEADHPALAMCFDAGHANFYPGRIGDKLRYCGDLIKIIHAHDNDGERDSHLHPYDGTVDWADFAEGLFDLGFSGVFNLETSPDKGAEALTEEQLRESEINLAKIAKLIAG